MQAPSGPRGRPAPYQVRASADGPIVAGMAGENATVVLGIPIPSTDPVFLAIVGSHVLFGMAAVMAGAVAMLSKKGRGRHSDWGTIYFWCLLGVFATMSALSFMRWA